MNTYKCILLVFIAAISTMAAAIDHDKPRRLRIANIADTNQLKLDGRILQTSTMSMATTESTDNIGVGYNNNMEVVDAIVSKLEEEGETADPMLAELLVLAAVDEYEESAMHHDDEYDFTEKCLRLLFIILPEYKASKVSFICGESKVTTTVTSSGVLSLPPPSPTTPTPLRRGPVNLIGIKRRLQTFNGWTPGAVLALEETIRETAQANLVPPTTVVDVTITSITVDATSGNQDVSYDLTLDVDCGGCSAAEISQAESDALATAASSLTTSIASNAFATAFEAELAGSGTTNCGNPPTCTNLVTSAGDATLTGLGLVSGLRVVYV